MVRSRTLRSFDHANAAMMQGPCTLCVYDGSGMAVQELQVDGSEGTVQAWCVPLTRKSSGDEANEEDSARGLFPIEQ
jgi:hypothetical protein